MVVVLLILDFSKCVAMIAAWIFVFFQLWICVDGILGFLVLVWCIWVCSCSVWLHRKVRKLKGKWNVCVVMSCVVVGFLRRETIVSTELDWLKLGQMVDPFGFIEMQMMKGLNMRKLVVLYSFPFWEVYCIGWCLPSYLSLFLNPPEVAF